MVSFSYLEQYKEYVREVQDKPLMLFGAGMNALNLLRTYFPHGEVTEIWDNSEDKQGKVIGGYEIKKPVGRDKYGSDAVFLIAVQDEIAIASITLQLSEMGYSFVYPAAVMSFANTIERYNVDFSKKFHELNSYKIITANEDKIDEVRRLLKDEKSRYVYDAIVEKTKYNLDSYTDVCDDIYDHYFKDDIFEYGNKEVFIDGGGVSGRGYNSPWESDRQREYKESILF